MELGYVNVDEMMDSLPASMFSEWIAYENYAGPIDKRWRDEILSQIHETLQLNNQLTGASIPQKKGKKNPAPKFRKVPRPWQIFKRDRDDEEPEEEEEDEESEDDAPAFGNKKRRR